MTDLNLGINTANLDPARCITPRASRSASATTISTASYWPIFSGLIHAGISAGTAAAEAECRRSSFELQPGADHDPASDGPAERLDESTVVIADPATPCSPRRSW